MLCQKFTFRQLPIMSSTPNNIMRCKSTKKSAKNGPNV